MKRYRLIEYAYLATLVLGFTACSQDELADGLPVNGTPVTFTASGIAAQQSATTRATTDGTWEEALGNPRHYRRHVGGRYDRGHKD